MNDLRLYKLRQKMSEAGIDATLIVKPENIFYFSKFTGDTGYVLIGKDKSFILVDPRFTEQAKIQTEMEVIEFNISFVEALLKQCERLNIKNIGFEDDYVSYMQYKIFSEKTKMNFIPLEGMLDDLRVIKDNEELQYIRKSVEIAEKSFSQVLKLVKPGITENDLAVELEYLFKKNGAQGVSFSTIVAAGSRSSLPHAEPSNNLVKRGDFLLFDFGCKYNGYCSDMTRTVLVGNANDEQRKIYNTVLNAQKAALDYIGPGKKCNGIDKVARDIISEAGYGKNFGHSLGHGVGLYIHENPRLSLSYDKELQPGMVVTIEPGIYIEGFGGVRIEDMVIIKEDGAENCMSFSKELIIL